MIEPKQNSQRDTYAQILHDQLRQLALCRLFLNESSAEAY